MTTVIIVLHVIVCVALILIVLLQTGKGADMGAAFGGGASQTLFGSTGASTFLSKATTIAAVVFMITSLALAYIKAKPSSGVSIMTQDKAPVEQSLPAAPDPPAATDNPPAAPPQEGAAESAQPK